MKKVFLLAIAVISFTGCTKEDDVNQFYDDSDAVWVLPYESPVKAEMIGDYKHHYGELFQGTIHIEPDLIVLNTTAITETFDLKTVKRTYYSNCRIWIELADGRIISIFNWMNKLNHVTLYVDGVFKGNYDFTCGEEQPTEPEPVEEPINAM